MQPGNDREAGWDSEGNGDPVQLTDQAPILNPVCCVLHAEADAAQGYFQIQTNSSS